MKITDRTEYVIEMDGGERRMLEEIARRGRETLEEALRRAILDFLREGVRTPAAEA